MSLPFVMADPGYSTHPPTAVQGYLLRAEKNALPPDLYVRLAIAGYAQNSPESPLLLDTRSPERSYSRFPVLHSPDFLQNISQHWRNNNTSSFLVNNWLATVVPCSLPSHLVLLNLQDVSAGKSNLEKAWGKLVKLSAGILAVGFGGSGFSATWLGRMDEHSVAGHCPDPDGAKFS